MNRPKLKTRVLLLIVFIFLFNFVSMSFHWYSLIPWLDMLMHFLGGLWLSLAAIFLIPFTESSIKFILKVMFAVLLIGVLWEVFEFVVKNEIFGEPFDLADTISDLFFDMAGAFFGYIYVIGRIMRGSGDKL